MEELIHFDEMLLLGINGLAGHPLLDRIMLLLSAKWTWLPLYAFILAMLIKHFGWVSTGWICLGAAAMVILTDQGSVQFFKETVNRLRPCHHAELQQRLVLVSGKCGGRYGFISSHAANVFGLAVLVNLLFKGLGRVWKFMFLWAALVAFSRVYLGVHYPSDIIAGALVGSLIGYLAAKTVIRVIAVE